MSIDAKDQLSLDERRFEQELQRWRLLAPPALGMRRPGIKSARFAILAVGVVVVAAIALVTTSTPIQTLTPGRQYPHPEARPRITLGQLNSALRKGDQDLEQLLGAASPALLPHEHRGTALYELSKE